MIAIAMLVALATPEAALQEFTRRVQERHGVRRLEEAPAFARDRGEPWGVFALVADVHWYPGRDADYVRRAARFLNQTRPHVVLFLGDTVWGQDMRAAHQEFREILEGHLQVPYFVVKGDNDARDHEVVWDSAEFAFDLAGVRFVALGMTRDWEGVGFGYYDQLDWLAGELGEARGCPAVVLTHVPAEPVLASMGGADLLWTVRRAGNVAAQIGGHYHLDLHWTERAPPVLAVASLGENMEAPLKIGRIYEDGIVLETYRAAAEGYEHDHKWQFLPFPEGTRADRNGGLGAVRRAPPRPTQFLTDRPPVMDFLRRFVPR